MEKELKILRADDLPLLYTIIKQLGLSEAVDGVIKRHGNWLGISPGELLELWLCYILSECDHRLSSVENWASKNLELLRVMSGRGKLLSVDFADDKLALLLDYLSDEEKRSEIESRVNGRLLGIYRLDAKELLNTFRLDAAPMQSYKQPKEGGLLQYGYHKQHSSLPQFKVKLCTLDNSVNNFAYPLCHLVVEGNKADDVLYRPIIAESKKVLSGIKGYEKGNLYVGDTKFCSIGNRAYVVENADYYLTPLPLVQLSKKERRRIIKASDIEDYKKVFKEEKKGKKLVAQGFEEVQKLKYTSEGKTWEWEERRLFVLSSSYNKSQSASLEKRLVKARESILELVKARQGKKVLGTKEEYENEVSKILKDCKVSGLLDYQLRENKSTRKVRAYGKHLERIIEEFDFELDCWRKEEAIEEHKSYLGWQVYATNTPIDLLSFESCVWKYRYQSNIESRFDDLRNKIAPLLPVFLQKDNRIKGLVNVLLLALKVCATMEYQVAKVLQDKEELLRGVYEGNPKRGTKKPSAKRILKAFKGISISMIFLDGQLQFSLITKLEKAQLEILKLLGLNSDIYMGLPSKIEMFFSNKKISET